MGFVCLSVSLSGLFSFGIGLVGGFFKLWHGVRNPYEVEPDFAENFFCLKNGENGPK